MSWRGHIDFEAQAWLWLMRLPRLDYKVVGLRRADGQIRIRMMGGELDGMSSAPLVRLTIEHPEDLGKRYRGSGNSLWGAVANLRAALGRAGIDTPRLERML